MPGFIWDNQDKYNGYVQITDPSNPDATIAVPGNSAAAIGASGYYDDLANMIDKQYTTADDALRRKYAGAARFRNANLDVNATRNGTFGSPTMQALSDVYANQGRKAMGADEVALEGQRLQAKVSAMQQKINYLIEQGRIDEAKALQKEQADAAAWGNILQAGATVAGFAMGGIPGAIIGGATGTVLKSAGDMAGNQNYMGSQIDQAYQDSVVSDMWNGKDKTVVTSDPYVDF
jgi:hypothetical protein